MIRCPLRGFSNTFLEPVLTFQFEPDHPLYVKTAETVYAAIDEKRDYEILKSTRCQI
jgi:hypothetical protein